MRASVDWRFRFARDCGAGKDLRSELAFEWSILPDLVTGRHLCRPWLLAELESLVVVCRWLELW